MINVRHAGAEYRNTVPVRSAESRISALPLYAAASTHAPLATLRLGLRQAYSSRGLLIEDITLASRRNRQNGHFTMLWSRNRS